MGTNYYRKPLVNGVPVDDGLHIGKSSAGWAFALRVHPELGINTIDDWRREWAADGYCIQNEYGKSVDAVEMYLIVTRRGSGLFRHVVDGERCIARGKGTYDLIRGEFS